MQDPYVHRLGGLSYVQLCSANSESLEPLHDDVKEHLQGPSKVVHALAAAGVEFLFSACTNPGHKRLLRMLLGRFQCPLIRMQMMHEPCIQKSPNSRKIHQDAAPAKELLESFQNRSNNQDAATNNTCAMLSYNFKT